MTDECDFSCVDFPEYCTDGVCDPSTWEDKDTEDKDEDYETEDKEDDTVYYTTFAEAIAGLYPDYTASTIDVVTSDNYIISMYKIESDSAFDSTLGPIIWMHGAGMDPTSWIQGFSPDDAPMIQMAADGHAVYMPSNRGNWDSLGHTTLNYIDDSYDYWTFALDDFALDMEAAVAAAANDLGNNEKGYYFGYSQGTTQAMIAMSTGDVMSTYLNRIILLAPCFGTHDGYDVT